MKGNQRQKKKEESGPNKGAALDGAALEISHHDVIGGDAIAYLLLESCA